MASPGILLGLKSAAWNDCPLVVMETSGADCFNRSIREGRIVKLDDIRSIAKSLGALAVCDRLWELTSDEKQNHPVVSHVVTDAMAVDACLKFERDHRLLVEPACGAVLSFLYSEKFKEAGQTVRGLEKVHKEAFVAFFLRRTFR